MRLNSSKFTPRLGRQSTPPGRVLMVEDRSTQHLQGTVLYAAGVIVASESGEKVS